MISFHEENTSFGPPGVINSIETDDALSRYRVWRKHVRDLYHTVFVHLIDHSTMTVQVLPYVRQNNKHSTIEHSLVSGSCRAAVDGKPKQSYISIHKAVTPTPDVASSLPINSETGEVGGYGHAPSACRMHTEMRIYHDGGVRRVRYIPWNPNILVSLSTDGNAYVFDKTEIAISKRPNNPCRPKLPLVIERVEDTTENSFSVTQESKRLKYANLLEEQERFDDEKGKGQHKLILTGGLPGSGPAPLDTSVNNLGSVASASDNKAFLWDILDYQCQFAETERKSGNEVGPRSILHACGTINDIKYSKAQSEILYAACENKHGVCIFDARMGSISALYSKVEKYAVSIDPSPFHGHLFAVGLSDGTVQFRDNRRMCKPLNSVQAHAPGTEVTSLLWSIHNPQLIASAGEDGSVVCTDYPDGYLRFKHSGHTSTVDDISWSWVDTHKGMIASVSSGDNLCMFWKPRNHIWKR